MDRRTALRALTFPLLAFAGTAASREPARYKDGWSDWKDRFLSADGRVIDDGNGGISHSEGQGFGALLAQANGDRSAFELIEAWTREHLLVRQDHLMAWRWRDETGVAAEDQATATDGDLFRAWALLRASRDSGWQDWADQAGKIAHDIAVLCLRPDPRVPESPLLTPGSAARAEKDRVLINPSYIMPRALRELGAEFAHPQLIAAADHGETVLSELASIGFVPDWVDVIPEGYAAPLEHEFKSGYDALRVALYLVWSGNFAHPAVARGAEGLAKGALMQHVAVVTTIDGDVRESSDMPGYKAIAALASCAWVKKSKDGLRDQPYYPATLELLARVAARESDANP